MARYEHEAARGHARPRLERLSLSAQELAKMYHALANVRLDRLFDYCATISLSTIHFSF